MSRSESAHGRGASNFRRLWSALTVALFGAQVTTLALPLTAALTLDASPLAMGMLAAAGQAPFLLLSLPIGVWVDRASRRRVLLVAADLGRALLLALVPLAALFDLLRLELLAFVAFASGALSVLFDIAHYSYVPMVTERERLTTVNARIQVSYSAADAAGPGFAGILVQLLTAPFAIAFTAVSFLSSAVMLRGIKEPSQVSATTTPRQSFRAEIVEGLRALLDHPLLRPIIQMGVFSAICFEAIQAVYLIYAIRELDLGATTIGIILATGGAAAIPGGLIAGRAAERFGFGTATLLGWLIEGGALLLIPLANPSNALPVLVLAQVAGGFAGALANVNQWSLRQIVTPDHLLARVTASHRCLVFGAATIGALAGGGLASVVSLRSTLIVFAIGAFACRLPLFWSPLASLRTAPKSHTDELSLVSA